MAIVECDAHALLVSGDIERPNVSHFIMQYDVKMDSPYPFEEVSLKFINDHVREQLETLLSRLNETRAEIEAEQEQVAAQLARAEGATNRTGHAAAISVPDAGDDADADPTPEDAA